MESPTARRLIERLKKYEIYKPNKAVTGGAFQFDLNALKESVFVEAASQKGEQEFDWSNKIVFKLGIADIGKLLAVIEGRKPSCDLFHDAAKAKLLSEESTAKNTTLSLAKGSYGFFLKVSRQHLNSSLQAVNIPLSDDEALLLRVLLEKAVERIYGW